MSIAQELKLQDALERIAVLEERVKELEEVRDKEPEEASDEARDRTLHLKDKADGKRQ